MGFDRSELITRIEDEFEVTISDGEAATVQSVAELCGIVGEKLDGPAAVMASRAFFQSSRAIAEVTGVERHSIEPDTLLEPLLPLPQRVEQWRAMAHGTGVQFPALVHAQRSKDLFMLLSMGIAAIPVLALWWSLNVLGWLPGIFFWLFSGPAFIAWVVLISRIHRRFLLATPRLAVELPFKSAGELATAVLALNMDAMEEAMNREALSSEAIFERVAKVVADWLQVAPDTVDENTAIGEIARVR
jgi:acyl carrier protein